MNTRKVVLAGVLAAAAIVTLGTFGLAVAQSTSGGSDMQSGMGSGHMSGQAGMDCDAMDGMTASGMGQMHEAVARALGISVDELNAQLAAGKTVAQIAAEKGIDMATVRSAMQAAHAAIANEDGTTSGSMMSGGMMSDSMMSGSTTSGGTMSGGMMSGQD
ncbi:MAG: hypothetical protein HYX53_08560 [Chloroflexi bacterium]|nr:hypothetical protein [Chloroflexota bacterium]